jgi:hypothetical protein
MASNLSLQGQGAIIVGTVTCDLASIGSAAIGEKTLTISGAAVGDLVFMNPPAAGLTAGLAICGAVVSAADTVKVRVANLSGGSVDEGSGTWSYCLIRS